MTNHGWCALLWGDEPTQMVMSPPPKLAFSCCIRGWCSLVYNCHIWDRCTSPTPCKTTSSGGDGERTPQEKDGNKWTPQWPSQDDLPVQFPWGGKMGNCGLDHGHLPEHLLKMGEDHRLSDLAADLRRNMYVRQRDDIYTHWHWWIVNWKRNAATHWTGWQQARPNKWNVGEWNG